MRLHVHTPYGNKAAADSCLFMSMWCLPVTLFIILLYSLAKCELILASRSVARRQACKAFFYSTIFIVSPGERQCTSVSVWSSTDRDWGPGEGPCMCGALPVLSTSSNGT